MTLFIDKFEINQNSLIWAFNETIDKNTQFDGNDEENSISQTKDIINYLLSEKMYDNNITEELLIKYLSIINNLYFDIINLYMKVVSSLKSLKKRDINCKVVRRRGKLYVINKKNPKFKARQG